MDVEFAEEFKRFKQEYHHCDKMLARNRAFLFDPRVTQVSSTRRDRFDLSITLLAGVCLQGLTG